MSTAAPDHERDGDDDPAPELELIVVGSINVDHTASVQRIPSPGETVGDGKITRHPGGKGANQAAAAAQLGARVKMIGCVGADVDGEWMLDTLNRVGVDTALVSLVPEPTGLAMVIVDAGGENQIVVCAGANQHLTSAAARLPHGAVVLTQLEIPPRTVLDIAARRPAYLAVNASPASAATKQMVPVVDLFIVNDGEFAAQPWLRDGRLVVVTHGADGASIVRDGQVTHTAPGESVTVASTVGAGDAFAAAITIALASGWTDNRALETACRVGSVAVGQSTAQVCLRRLGAYSPPS